MDTQDHNCDQFKVVDGGELGSIARLREVRDYSVARSEAKTVNVAANDNEVAYALAA